MCLGRSTRSTWGRADKIISRQDAKPQRRSQNQKIAAKRRKDRKKGFENKWLSQSSSFRLIQAIGDTPT
jgi:hypothetical protein